MIGCYNRISPVCQFPWREQDEDGIETRDKGDQNWTLFLRLLMITLSFAFGVGALV
jgi:hypothetical protein